MTTTALFTSSTEDAEYRQYTGERVEIVRPLDPEDPKDCYDVEVGPMFRVRAADGAEFDAFGDELREEESENAR